LTAHRYRSCIESGPRTSDHSRHAREVLSDAGWLFDHFVNAEMRKVLMSQPEERDQREEAYRRARVATEMKAGLESLIETYEADSALIAKRLDRLKKQREHTLSDRPAP
jgi:hypothetical protein